MLATAWRNHSPVQVFLDCHSVQVGDVPVACGPGALFKSSTFVPSLPFCFAAGAYPAWGESYARWNDPVQANTWAVPWVVLMPTTVPVGTAATGYSGGVFTLAEAGGTTAVPVNLSTTPSSGTLVYQVDRTNGIVTVSAVDITTPAGQTTITNDLTPGTPVKVFGVPQPNNTIKAYVVICYTGTLPMATAVD